MKAPIIYIPNFIPTEDLADRLWSDLAWTQVAGNRREYYANAIPGGTYTYGRGIGQRTYQPQPTHPVIEQLRAAVQQKTLCALEAVVLNGYEDGNDALGFHSDDSPEVDPQRPIAVISLGEIREIMFRPRPDLGVEGDVERLTLGSGSLLIMPAGMQQTHQHRIPKAGRVCGKRVSLTFRGYRAAVATAAASAGA
mgnify:CR=1 FL=1